MTQSSSRGGRRSNTGAPRQYVTLAELPASISFVDITLYLSSSTRLELSALPEAMLRAIASYTGDKHVKDGVANELKKRADAVK